MALQTTSRESTRSNSPIISTPENKANQSNATKRVPETLTTFASSANEPRPIHFHLPKETEAKKNPGKLAMDNKG